MRGNAKVQVLKDKKRDRKKYLIYLPRNIVKALNIKKGNIVDFDVNNPNPDYVEAPRNNFKKDESPITEQPE